MMDSPSVSLTTLTPTPYPGHGPDLTTIPFELRRLILEDCILGSELLRPEIHPGREPYASPGYFATRHHCVLLACKRFYKDGIAIYYQHATLITDCGADRPLAKVHTNNVQKVRLLNPGSVQIDDLLTWTINPFQKLRTVELEKCAIRMIKMTETIPDVKIWNSMLKSSLLVPMICSIARSVAATFPCIKVVFACSVSSTDLELDCDVRIAAQAEEIVRKRIRGLRQPLHWTRKNNQELELGQVRFSDYDWRPAPKPENDG